MSNGAVEMKEDFPLNMFKALDLNRDGKITFKEFSKKKSTTLLKSFMAGRSSSTKINKKFLKEEFNTLDKNNDKIIEPKEIDISLDGRVIFPKNNNAIRNKKEQATKKRSKKD